MVKVKGSDKVEPTGAAPAAASTGGKAPRTVAKSAKSVKAAKPAATKPAKAPGKPATPAAKHAASKATAASAAKPSPAPAPATVPGPVLVAVPSATPVAAASGAEPKLVKPSSPVVTGPEMKKKDLIEKVVKRSGVKKKDAKLVVEAMLAVLGEALAEGRELVLQPMGRLKTTRVKDSGNGRVMICRLRQGGGEGKGGKEALAEDDD